MWYILHAIGVISLSSTSACQLALSSDTPPVSYLSTSVSATFTESFAVSVGCSWSEMLYIKSFLILYVYFFLHIYIDIIKFSSCIFIDTYMFLDVSVIIIDILAIYYSIQAVTL